MPRPNYPQEFGSEWKQVKRRVQQAFTAANSRIRFGRIEAADISVQDGGDINVTGGGGVNVEGGAIVIYDSGGVEQMRLSTAGLSLEGLLSVLGSIRATDGSISAADGTGDVFRVDPTVPEIFMRPELISAVARQVIGESVFFDFNQLGGQRDAFASFGDLEIAGNPDVGPTVSFDLDGDKFLAIWGANTTLNTLSSTGDDAAGRMSVEVSGPSSFSPSTVRSAQNEFSVNNDQRVAMTQGVSMGRMFSSLSSGSYTVTAKYEVSNSTDELDDVRWLSRWLVVIAF